MQRVQPFPWGELPKITADGILAERGARAVLANFDPTRLAAAVKELVAEEVEAWGIKASRSHFTRQIINSVVLPLRVGGAQISLEVEPQLVVWALTRVLDRPASLDVGGALSPALQGAWAALVDECARRSACTIPPELTHQTSAAQASTGVQWSAWLRLGGTVFRVILRVQSASGAAPEPATPQSPSVDRLRALPITLPLVVARVTVAPAELASLRPGDVWLPGAGWWSNANGRGSAGAIAPLAESGLTLNMAAEIKYLEPCAMPHEPPTTESEKEPMTEESSKNAALQAPVVVRLECGAVTMTAEEWLNLSAGDVLGTGQPLRGPVTLRIAGRQVASGELVDVDGQLGVRIVAITGELDSSKSESAQIEAGVSESADTGSASA